MSNDLDNVDTLLTGRKHGGIFVCSKRKLLLKRSLIGSGSFNVLLIITLVVLYFVEHKRNISQQTTKNSSISTTKLQKNISTENNNIFCMPCEQLGDDIELHDTTYDIITTSTCNQKVCCNYRHPELQRLIIQSLVENRNSHSNADKRPEELNWWFNRRYSAHLSRDIESKGLIWTNHTEDELTFINDLELEQNNITIPTRDASGLYFVYSVITQKFEDADKLPVSYHQIVKSNPALIFKGKLKETIVSMKKYGGAAGKSATQTSFLCTITRLQRGDQIAARVGSGTRNREFIASGRMSNYFGMFRL